MKKLLMFLIIIGTVHAAEFTFYDASTNEKISDAYVLMKLYIGKELVHETSTTIRNGVLSIDVPKEKYNVAIFIDILSTQGRDYYRSITLNVKDEKQEIAVFPIGSISGRTLQRDEVIASHASLLFDCDKDFGIEYPEFTDSVGYFSVAYIPTGACKIKAQNKNFFTIYEVNISQGEREDLTLVLDNEMPSNKYYYLTGIIILLIGIAVFLKQRKKKVKMPALDAEETQAAIKLMKSTPEETMSKIEQDKRIQDIIKTLSEDEKIVVDFLIKHKFKASQPQIYKATLLPRTSLARQILRLEAKKIIQVEKMRKIKELELTDWFIGEYKN